jgi:hypothetical protein
MPGTNIYEINYERKLAELLGASDLPLLSMIIARP